MGSVVDPVKSNVKILETSKNEPKNNTKSNYLLLIIMKFCDTVLIDKEYMSLESSPVLILSWVSFLVKWVLVNKQITKIKTRKVGFL